MRDLFLKKIRRLRKLLEEVKSSLTEKLADSDHNIDSTERVRRLVLVLTANDGLSTSHGLAILRKFQSSV